MIHMKCQAFFSPKIKKDTKKLASAAVVNGDLRVNCVHCVINPLQTNGIFHKVAFNKVRRVHNIY